MQLKSEELRETTSYVTNGQASFVVMATALPRTDLQLTVIKEVMLVGNVYKTF